MVACSSTRPSSRPPAATVLQLWFAIPCVLLFCVRFLAPGLDCVVSPLFVFLLFSLQGFSTFVTLICLCLLIPECVIVFTVVTPWFLFSVACSPHHVGAGYVGVSRFQTRDGVYLYSRLRSSDFVPVDLEQEHPEKITCPTCHTDCQLGVGGVAGLLPDYGVCGVQVTTTSQKIFRTQFATRPS